MVAGLFVAFEGVDGSGKTTQIGRVAEAIKSWERYQDVVLTMEPTYRLEKLRREMGSDMFVNKNSRETIRALIEDNVAHYQGAIRDDLGRKRAVLCDNYSMGILAHGNAEGIPIEEIVKMYPDISALRGIPDVTFYLAIDPDKAIKRIRDFRNKGEKFRENLGRRADRYEEIYRRLQEGENPRLNNLLGRVIRVNGEIPMSEVTHSMTNLIEPIYLRNKE